MVRRRPLFARIQWHQPCLWAAWTLALAACASAGLNTGGTATRFDLVVQSGVDNTKNHPANAPFSVRASCPAGQQMVGGGYKLISNSNANPTWVAVEGTFPSGPATWTVQVRNPDNASIYNGDADVVVMALAYCMTTSNYDLDIEIDSTGPTTVSRSPGATTDIDIRCSVIGGLALSGGFRTTSLPVFTDGAVHQAFWPGLQGSGITSSSPRLADNTHSSMGWHLTQEYTPALVPTAPQPDVVTKAYTICARKSINGQSRRIVTVSGVLSGPNPPAEATALCEQGEFTVGGGYDHLLVTLPLGQGGVSETEGSLVIHSPFAFDGWQVSGRSLNMPIDAIALCVRIPSI